MDQDTVRTVAVVLVLAGAGVGVWGIGWYQSGSDCDPYYLSVDATQSGSDDVPTVAYENLTAAQQRTFRRTLATDDNYRGFSEPQFDGRMRVQYRGDTYLVSLIVSDGCRPLLNFLLRAAPVAAGGGGLLAGGYLLYRGRP